MKVNLSFDIEDFYMSSTFDNQISKDTWDSLPLNINAGMEIILSFLKSNRIKATFFFLGYVANRNPKLVEKVLLDGHEVASHGYLHLLVNNLSDKEFYNDLFLSKKILEEIAGSPIVGFRAPTFSMDFNQLSKIMILEDLGFKYDSSLFPLKYKRNGSINFGNEIFKIGKSLYEVPLSVSKLGLFNLPIGGGYFRLFPYSLNKYLLKTNTSKSINQIYLHPWEFDNRHLFKPKGLISNFRHTYGIGENLIDKLTLLSKDFQFNGTLKSIIEEYE